MKKIMYVMGMLLFLTAISSCSDDAETVNGENGVAGRDGKDGKNGRDGKDCSTKHNQLILFGDVTNEEAKEQIKNFSSEIYSIEVANTTQLTELDLSKFKKVNSINIRGNKQLRSIHFDNLTTVYGGIWVYKSENLYSLNFPKLLNCKDVTIQQSKDLTTVNFPVLTNCDNIMIFDDASLRNFDFSKLSTSKNITINLSVKKENPKVAVSLLRSLSQKNTPLKNATITVYLLEKEKYETEVEGYVNILKRNGNTVNVYWY